MPLALSNLAGYFSRTGNYAEALSTGEEARAIRERVLGRQHPDYAESLNNLAKYHYFLKEYDKAIEIESEALDCATNLWRNSIPIMPPH